MEPITSSEYYTECESIAREAVQEANGDRDTAYDHLHQDVDGHRWIIYTYYHTQILTHSQHDNAYFEDFGPLEAESFSDATLKMAYAAMLRDCTDYLETALDEYEPPEEESAE